MFNSGSRKCTECVYVRCSFDKLLCWVGFDVFCHEVFSRTCRKGTASGGAAAADTKGVCTAVGTCRW